MARAALLIAFILAALAAGFAPPAGAAVLTYASEYQSANKYQGELTAVQLTFAAAPGEINRVAVEVADGAIVVRDPGAVIDPGRGGCERVEPHVARCPVPAGSFNVAVTIRAGDGDDEPVLRPSGSTSFLVYGEAGADRLDAAALFSVLLDGGDGDDVLTGASDNGTLQGGEGDDRLQGGAGSDTMAGGAGDDVLVGGPGRDVLAGEGRPGEAVGDDVLDGGPDSDRVSYAQREDPVSVDLADPAPDGGAGESDQVRAIEDVTGGRGDDRLAGDDGPNELDACFEAAFGGCPGDDVIAGRGGADRLAGGSGRDRLDGGAGDDRLRGGKGADELDGGAGGDEILDSGRTNRIRAGAGDDVITLDGPQGGADVRCGSGADTVNGFTPLTIVTACERLGTGHYSLRLRRTPEALVVRVRSNATRCEFATALRSRGRTLATAAARIGPGRSATLRLDHRRRRRVVLHVAARRCTEPAFKSRRRFELRG